MSNVIDLNSRRVRKEAELERMVRERWTGPGWLVEGLREAANATPEQRKRVRDYPSGFIGKDNEL